MMLRRLRRALRADHVGTRVLITGLALALAASLVGTAKAKYTSEKHDADLKYYNSRVSYSDNGETVTLTSRQFKGGRNGGAQKWRQEQIKEVSGGSTTATYGPGSWAFNVPLSSWYSYSSEGWTTYSSTVTVSYLFKYYECIPNECYYWYIGDALPIKHVITP